MQYDPVTGARLEWVQQAELTRSLDNASAGQWNWAMPADQPNNPWSFVTADALTNPNYRADRKSGSGELVTQAHPQGIVVIGNPNDAKFTQTITGGITDQTSSGSLPYQFSGFNFSICETVPIACAARSSAGNNPGDSDSTTHTFNMPTDLWLKVTSSVKADNPFNISFKGGTVGAVTINSNASVTFADQLTNSSGTTRVTAAGSITQGGDAFLRTKNLILDATGGQGAAANNAASNIGSAAQPFAATINGGVVSAQAGAGGIYVNLTGTSTVGKVIAKDASGYGDISYRKTGDILAAGGADAVPINFIGDNISLTAIGGKIGDASVPIVISANSHLDQNGAAVGGVVDMVAQGDINIKQTSQTPGGRLDLRLGTLSSASGDVTVEVTNGALVDARGLTAGDALSQDQVDAIAQLLHLTAADGASQSAIDRSVTPFETLITNNYNRYFRMKSDACTTNCAAFLVPASALDLYRPLAAAALKVTISALTDAQVLDFIATAHQENGTLNLSDTALALYRPLAMTALNLQSVTDDQVRAYADAQYQGIVGNFRQAFGDGWTNLTRFAAPSYASYLTLKGQNCTANCAAFSVSDAALAFYRPLAATALQVGSPTDTQVRDYIATVHNKYGTVNLSADALSDYRSAAQSAIGGANPVTDADVRAYADAKFQGLATTYTFTVADAEAVSDSRVLAHGPRGVGSGADRRRHRPDRVPAGVPDGRQWHTQHHRPQRHTPRWRRPRRPRGAHSDRLELADRRRQRPDPDRSAKGGDRRGECARLSDPGRRRRQRRDGEGLLDFQHPGRRYGHRRRDRPAGADFCRRQRHVQRQYDGNRLRSKYRLVRLQGRPGRRRRRCRPDRDQESAGGGEQRHSAVRPAGADQWQPDLDRG